MINILIFRTDRIGDLIVTCPAIVTLKKNFIDSKITLISSKRNHQYAKSLGIFDEIICYPEGILKKILFIKNIYKKKFDYIFIYDGKERSILISAFIKSDCKIAITQKKKLFFSLLNIQFFIDSEKTNLNTLFQDTFDYCNIKKSVGNYDFLLKKDDNGFSLNIPASEYLHIHLDEKWFNELYIKNYTNIKPDYNNFTNFLDSLLEKNNIVITTGIVDFNLVDDLKVKYFTKKIDNIYTKKKKNNFIYFIIKPTFDDLESLLRKAKTLISCHGAITHASNSFGVKKIDILEYKRKLFYKKFTSYLKDYHPVYREPFTNLSMKILNLLKE